MDKQTAINLLGGTQTRAARAIGITQQSIRCWPNELSRSNCDRVFAAVVRQHPNDWQRRWPIPLHHSANDTATVARQHAPVSMRGARP